MRTALEEALGLHPVTDSVAVEHLLEECRAMAREIEANPQARDLPEAKRVLAHVKKIEAEVRELHAAGVFKGG